ncbi:MAG TPA: hypothetical protein VH079_10985 [Terriglobales bacterium]|nr:hypothetical protein [Terriglobales bacterium]
MLIFPICLVVAVIVCFHLDEFVNPVDYNLYIRELKLNIPGISGDYTATTAK